MFRSPTLLIVSGAALLAGLVALTFLGSRRHPSAPLPVLRQVGSFTVTNQSGAVVDAVSLRGRPWAVNLIFTRCPGPCLQLTKTMKAVQDGLASGSKAGLLSITSDPAYDTPAVLRAYGDKAGADPSRWQFVTGSTAGIRQLATGEFLLVLVDKPEDQRAVPEDLFLHSTLIVVMDGRGQLRTAIEGLEPGAAGKVLDALRRLEAED